MKIFFLATFILTGLLATSHGRQRPTRHPSPPTMQEVVLHSPFRAGVTHISGRYRFTEKNFMLEGAEQIAGWGSEAIFLYLMPGSEVAYPDNSELLWTGRPYHSLKDLVQAEAYKKTFALFKTIILTVYPYENDEREFYELTKYLIETYQGSGKIFVFKIWEGDWAGLQDFDASKDITSRKINEMIAWLSPRQRGVERARAEFSRNPGVAVLNAVEVNRVLDHARQGLKRVIDSVIPSVKPDMVTYSSWDAINDEKATSKAGIKEALFEALDTIDHYAPDPMGLGKKRILISEYGAAENQHPADEIPWRIDGLLDAAAEYGTSGAFWWEIYDNECNGADGKQLDVSALAVGDPRRPTADRCSGHWLIRPDGSEAPSLQTLKKRWEK